MHEASAVSNKDVNPHLRLRPISIQAAAAQRKIHGLSAKNAAALRKLLAPYIEHARKVGRAQARRAGRTAASLQRPG